MKMLSVLAFALCFIFLSMKSVAAMPEPECGEDAYYCEQDGSQEEGVDDPVDEDRDERGPDEDYDEYHQRTLGNGVERISTVDRLVSHAELRNLVAEIGRDLSNHGVVALYINDQRQDLQILQAGSSPSSRAALLPLTGIYVHELRVVFAPYPSAQ